VRHGAWASCRRLSARCCTTGVGELGLRRVEADIDPRNARSAKILERLGFIREGYLRERWVVGGEISDTALYGLLAREFIQHDRS